MLINLDKTQQWKNDVVKSVDYYNKWFLNFAPTAFRDTRSKTAQQVLDALEHTSYLSDITPAILKLNPAILSILRMTTRPPLAHDRLVGLAGVSKNLVKTMEEKDRLPVRMNPALLESDLAKIVAVISSLLDEDVFPWLATKRRPTEDEKVRASMIVADRVCTALANPIVRNAQEKRQLDMISTLLEKKGYTLQKIGQATTIDSLPTGSYAFHLNVPVSVGIEGLRVNIPVDVAIKPKDTSKKPILIEAKSAGDFTNTNKRRKEEAVKHDQLRSTYGTSMQFLLFLCGYFDTGYLGYEAAAGIDWIWEHRIEDFEFLGL